MCVSLSLSLFLTLSSPIAVFRVFMCLSVCLYGRIYMCVCECVCMCVCVSGFLSLLGALGHADLEDRPMPEIPASLQDTHIVSASTGW